METPEQRAEPFRFRERAKKIKKQMLSMADQYEALAARDLEP
jgi:hypothetical protein